MVAALCVVTVLNELCGNCPVCCFYCAEWTLWQLHCRGSGKGIPGLSHLSLPLGPLISGRVIRGHPPPPPLAHTFSPPLFVYPSTAASLFPLFCLFLSHLLYPYVSLSFWNVVYPSICVSLFPSPPSFCLPLPSHSISIPLSLHVYFPLPLCLSLFLIPSLPLSHTFSQSLSLPPTICVSLFPSPCRLSLPLYPSSCRSHRPMVHCYCRGAALPCHVTRVLGGAGRETEVCWVSSSALYPKPFPDSATAVRGWNPGLPPNLPPPPLSLPPVSLGTYDIWSQITWGKAGKGHRLSKDGKGGKSLNIFHWNVLDHLNLKKKMTSICDTVLCKKVWGHHSICFVFFARTIHIVSQCLY